MAYRENVSIDLVSKTLTELVETYHYTTDETEQRWVKQLIQLGCRKLEDFITPQVSAKAQKVADQKEIGELSQFGWLDQKTKMNDLDRSTFHFEHILTVSDLVDILLKLGSEPSVDDVKSIIEKADIAWILKSEDQVLNEKGYKNKRPENPLDAYEICGIELV